MALEVGGTHRYRGGFESGVAGVGADGAGAEPLALRPARRPITVQPYDFTLLVRPNDPFYFFHNTMCFCLVFKLLALVVMNVWHKYYSFSVFTILTFESIDIFFKQLRSMDTEW